MAIITNPDLFSWRDFKDLGDLERLVKVFQELPDEKLVQTMERKRGIRGRNDYPVRAIWNSLIAKIVFQHPSVEALRRELLRNAQLREVCGFRSYKGVNAVPSPCAYARFQRQLEKHHVFLEDIENTLVKKCYAELPDFGKNLAIDGKIIHSFSRGTLKKKNVKKPKKKRDLRRENDADFTIRSYIAKEEKRARYHFGFKANIVCDANYELPVAHLVTTASVSEYKAADKLILRMEKKTPWVLIHCQHWMADRGYDSGSLKERLWRKYNIKPIIDLRNILKGGDETYALAKIHPDIAYDSMGHLFWYDMQGEKHRMVYAGFEKDRNTLKFRSKEMHYQLESPSKEKAPKTVRIPLSTDPRIFTPIPRCSYKWKKLYRLRTSIERVNSRIATSFGLGNHTIRGLAKMKVHVSLSLSIMTAIGLARNREKRPDLIRSLVKAA